MTTRLSSRFRNFLIVIGLLPTFIALSLFRHRTVNFGVSGDGWSATALEVALRPDSPPEPDVWGTVNNTHRPRFNTSYGAYIPNIVNFVHLLPEGVCDFNFPFKDVLAIYAAWLYSDPDVIYFHTNAAPDAIERARSGMRGKWNSMIFNVPQLIVKYADSPDCAENGVEITRMEHKSDFVRVVALEENGGIYLDMDAIPLRDLRPLLRTGFNTVLGRQLNGEIMSGNFIGKPRCQFFTSWRTEMHKVYDQKWVTHSNGVMTSLGKKLARIDQEILIMESPVMGPIYWKGEATQAFYGVHDDVESNLKGLLDGDLLLDFDDGWEERRNTPEWQRDYSETYILHSWHEDRLRLPKGFDHVTPRYVLDRRSDFARAVYPIVKHMYDHGFIAFDDPWKYTVLEK